MLSVNERVEKIKNDKSAINTFIEEYKPFIASCVEKETNRYVRYGEDDELSIGLMAFMEAVKSYDCRKGSFLSFAQNVIKRRLIDYYRREKKHSTVIPISRYANDDEDSEFDMSVEESIGRYSDEEISEYRRLELQELKNELDGWGITFDELVQVSPKHNKTRKMNSDIVKFLLSRPDLIANSKSRKYLPIAEIENALGIPRKKIERSRKYILAVLIIATGDYQYIRDYISWEVV